MTDRLDDGGDTLLGDGEERVGRRGGADCIQGDLYRAVCTVLEADRHRAGGRELSMNLGLCELVSKDCHWSWRTDRSCVHR